MSQNRINILCTRDIDETLKQDARSKNLDLDVISFIKTEPALTIDVLNAVQKTLTHTGAVVFTSVNAVGSIVTFLDQRNTSPIEWKIFCIGYATRQSVVKYFGERSIAGEADNASELAETILDANVKEVIFFCGDQRRDELPELLRKNKIDVQEIIVYKTIVTPQKIEKKYDGILFFSPSAVKGFFENNIQGDQTVLFAIGSTTADEIRKFSENKIVVSDVPDKKALFNKVVSYFQMNPIHQ
jgi:uroporphyrinogen-III synthase